MGDQAKQPKIGNEAVKTAVRTLAGEGGLPPASAADALREIMTGTVKPELIGAFLALLSIDRCEAGIIHALADVMRTHATPVELPQNRSFIVDIVGTGGDGQDTFNISTTAGLVAAAAGVQVVKHGNRAASSKSGAADLLEAMGAKLKITPEQVGPVLAASGFAFLFARSYHPSMQHVGLIRKELGIRTVFNILGPLTNPAKPDGMVCGVYSPKLGRLFAETLQLMGMKRALVVHGCEGLDELSIEGPSMIWELKEDGNITEYQVTPTDFGIKPQPLSEVSGGTPAENAVELKELLVGKGRAAVRDMVLMNAGAALYVAGKAASFEAGVELARATLSDGRATKVSESFVAATHGRF